MPLSIATFAASLMCSGVSKSGSPALMLMTFIPADLISIAFDEIAIVAEGLTFLTLSDIGLFILWNLYNIDRYNSKL